MKTTFSFIASLLVLGCAHNEPSWKWQVTQPDTESVVIVCPANEVQIEIDKRGGSYYINFYDTSRKNCFVPSKVVTGMYSGHRHAVVEVTPVSKNK